VKVLHNIEEGDLVKLSTKKCNEPYCDCDENTESLIDKDKYYTIHHSSMLVSKKSNQPYYIAININLVTMYFSPKHITSIKKRYHENTI
jgi:hypothetical protein